MISIKNLNKYFNKGKNNEIHVISDTSLELPDTGLATFLGESGSGKTTLLNVIGGLDKASGTIDYGDVTLHGYSMGKIDRYRRSNIGYIFQNYNLLLTETVYDNLRIALDIINVTDPEEQEKRIKYALEAVHMYKFRKKYAYALSGGQQQRVSIARALVKNSKIIIADEPTGNLDSKNTMDVMNILRKISEKSLVLLVTHEIKIAEFYSDIIFNISDGKIIGKREIEGNSSVLDEDDQTKIYKGDLDLKTSESAFGKINVYSNDEFDKIDFNIYVKNGTIYLDTSKPVKLVGQSNIKILEGKKDLIKREDIEIAEAPEFTQGRRIGKLRIILDILKKSFLRLKPTKKKVWFVYIALFVLGINFASAVTSYLNSENDYLSETYSYNPNYYTEKTEYYDTVNNIAFRYLYEAGVITDYRAGFDASFSYSVPVTLVCSSSGSISVTAAPYYEEDVKLYTGVKPSGEYEAVISKNCADVMISRVNGLIDYSDILGLSIQNYYGDFKVVGISKNDNDFVYLTEEGFSYIYYRRISAYVAKEDEKGIGYLSDSHYTITSGTKPSAKNEILLPDTTTENIGDAVKLDSGDYIVTGKYTLTDTEVKNLAGIVTFDSYMSAILTNQNVNYYAMSFYVLKSDANKANQYLEEINYGGTLVAMKDSYASETSYMDITYIVTSIVLASISSMLIYFTMRSRMISEIYSIGVYRCLGMSRAKVIGRFALDDFITATFTLIIGYTISYFFTFAIAKMVKDVLGGVELFAVSVGGYFAGAGILYAIMLVFGLLPILGLLLKTPKEICSKYDI